MKNKKIKIKHKQQITDEEICGKYYICIEGETHFGPYEINDTPAIAHELRLRISEFERIMQEEFRGCVNRIEDTFLTKVRLKDTMFFENREDAEKALEWAQSALMSVKLRWE